MTIPKDIEYQPTVGLDWKFDDRSAALDILCITKNDTYIVLELHLGQSQNFKDRVVFYASHLMHHQPLRKNNWYNDIMPVYIVSILNFNIYEDDASKNNVIGRACFCNASTKKRVSDMLEIVYLELPKFNKEASELKDNTDMWLYLLKNTGSLKFCPPELTAETFIKFLEIAEFQHLTSEELKSYKVSLKKKYKYEKSSF